MDINDKLIFAKITNSYLESTGTYAGMYMYDWQEQSSFTTPSNSIIASPCSEGKYDSVNRKSYGAAIEVNNRSIPVGRFVFVKYKCFNGEDTYTFDEATVSSWKMPCVVRTVGNINISNPGTSTINGWSVTRGDRILVPDQTSSSENGIYIFDTSSTPLILASDFVLLEDRVGATVLVLNGTIDKSSFWRVSSATLSSANFKKIVGRLTYANYRTTAEITLSSPGSSTSNFDGQTPAVNDIVLVCMQNSGTGYNGVYYYNGPSSPMTRVSYFNEYNDFIGATVYLLAGTTFGKMYYTCTQAPVLIPTNPNYWEAVPNLFLTKKTFRQTGTTTAEPSIVIDPNTGSSASVVLYADQSAPTTKPVISIGANSGGGGVTINNNSVSEPQIVSMATTSGGGGPGVTFTISNGLGGSNNGGLAYYYSNPYGSNVYLLGFDYLGTQTLHAPIVHGCEVIAGRNGSPAGGYKCYESSTMKVGLSGTLGPGCVSSMGIITNLGSGSFLSTIDGTTPTTLTGYLKGNGSTFTASSTIPTTDLSGTITNAQLAGSIAFSKLIGTDIELDGGSA